MINVYEVAEDEYIAAESAESAAEFYKNLVSDKTYKEVQEEFGEPQELSEEQLKKFRFYDEAEDKKMSFAERLTEVKGVSKDSDFPQFFAAIQ